MSWMGPAGPVVECGVGAGWTRPRCAGAGHGRVAPTRARIAIHRDLSPVVSSPAHACYARDLPGHFDEPLWLSVDGAGGLEMSVSDRCLIRSRGPSGEPVIRLGVPLVDDYLEFLDGRCRPNTVLAAAYDLKVFFGVVDTAPGEVCPADVLGFVTAQRT